MSSTGERAIPECSMYCRRATVYQTIQIDTSRVYADLVHFPCREETYTKDGYFGYWGRGCPVPPTCQQSQSNLPGFDGSFRCYGNGELYDEQSYGGCSFWWLASRLLKHEQGLVDDHGLPRDAVNDRSTTFGGGRQWHADPGSGDELDSPGHHGESAGDVGASGEEWDVW